MGYGVWGRVCELGVGVYVVLGDVVQLSVASYDPLWCGVVWCGAVWCGVVVLVCFVLFIAPHSLYSCLFFTLLCIYLILNLLFIL